MGQEAAIKLAFYGTPAYSLPTLEALHKQPWCRISVVITQPDRPAQRGQQLQCSPIKEFALKHRLPILQPENIRKQSAAFLKDLRAFGALDAAVVIAFGQILPSSVLEYPSHGSLNLHASLLPRWRGAAPIQRAILAGDAESGVCLMRMEAGLDTGPVYSSISTPISTADDAGTLHDRLAELSAQIVCRDLKGVVRGELKATAQSDTGVTYANKIEPKDALIDWSHPASQLNLQIRAFSPHPGAFTTFQGRRIKIFRASVRSDTAQKSTPGTIIIAEGAQLEIAAGGGVLALHELQGEGKRRMEAAEFLRGNRLIKGSRLGE